MSVIVKGLDVPKNCYKCDYPLCGLWARHEVEWQKENRDKECPIIVLPPHGRLIDADALNYTMLYKENWMSGTGVEAPAVWRKDIEDAPTIIPAEEGE